MSKIEDAIKDVFLMENDTLLPVTFDNIQSYLIKNSVSYSVAIPLEWDRPIHEDFVGMEIYTSFANFAGKSVKVLALNAPYTIDVDNLVLIAADFISADNRDEILKNPYQWIDKWKALFGDSIKKKMVFDVIGEMLVLKHFYQTDKSLTWMGQVKGTHDIVGKETIYEVKSTVKKTGNVVGIHSSYQLSTERHTKLAFVRLEKKPHASLSINKLAKELIGLGFNSTEIEKSLEANGYKAGDRLRDDSYELLSFYLYAVTKDDFPIFSLEDINKLVPKQNVIGFELSIDLTPVSKTVIFEKESVK